MNKEKVILILKSALSLALLACLGFAISKAALIKIPTVNNAIFAGALTGIAVIIVCFWETISIKKSVTELNQVVANKDKEIEEKTIQIEQIQAEINSNKALNDRTDTLSKIIQESDSVNVAASGILEVLANEIEICQGVLYVANESDGTKRLQGVGTYAYHKLESELDSPPFGVGLVGQTAQENKALFINELPSGYIDVVSGLGSSKPNYLALIPLVYSGEVLGVLELASFKEFTEKDKEFFKMLETSIGTGIHFLNQTKILEELKRNQTEPPASVKETATPVETIEHIIEDEELNDEIAENEDSEESIESDEENPNNNENA